MRISSKQDSPHWHPSLSIWVEVFLEDRRMEGVTEADEEGGWIEIDSRLYGFEVNPGELRFGIVILKGNVRIEVHELAPDEVKALMSDIRAGRMKGSDYGASPYTGQGEGGHGQEGPGQSDGR